MKLNESLLLMLMLMVGIAPGSALPQSVTAMVAGRVIGLPSGNVPSFEVVLVSNGAPCAVLKAHVLADGSFRFSSIRAGNYFVAVEGLSDGYGINTMTAGTVDLLFDSMGTVADAPTPVLIEIARFEEIRRKPSVMHVRDSLRSQCLIHQVKPLYSSQAKAAHVVGDVIMSVGIDKNGYVEDVMVVQGHPLLIQSAINAVRQWRYIPTVFLGQQSRRKPRLSYPSVPSELLLINAPL